MSSVLVAGSRQASRFPAEVTARLDAMIEKEFQILVGNANGADKAVKRYLAERYARFVSGEEFRQPGRNRQGARA